MRVQREIPARLIPEGRDKGNLRERALMLLKAKGRRCRCVRCREVRSREIKETVEPDSEDVRLIKTFYIVRGTEIFLSREDPGTDTLIAYLRLRIPSH